jgi:uncharacterized repeat protein (TIGR01451 family)
VKRLRHDGSRGRATKRGLWVLTLLATAALFAFLPGIATGANPSANLDQCANGPAPSSNSDGCDVAASDWVNGNLGASKAVYFEGDSIPYRMVFDNLSLGTHTVTIEWDTTKSSKHAIDYIDSYNQSVLDANPCLGITMVPACNFLAPSSTFSIPADPQVTGAGVTPIPGNLTLFGGMITGVVRPTSIGSTTCTDANSAGVYCYSSGTGFSGDKSAAITVQFTASVANPVLAWGGHIAARKDWGLNNSAVSIPGSPYHTRLIDLDGAGGNQDRSLSAEAVIFPGFIHIVKNTTGGDATFGYTASPSPLSNFNITTVGGTGEQDFNNITNFQTYTVTENSPPLHWVFDSLNCSVASANGGTQAVTNMTATIGLAEGEQVTCTYANHHAVNSPTITTQLSGGPVAVGSTVHDSATLHNATSDASGTVKYRFYSSLAACNDAGNTFASPGGTGAGEKTVTNGSVPDSDAVQFNSAGTFYWRAWYSGDGNNNATSSACADETLLVLNPGITITKKPDSQTIRSGETAHWTITVSNTGDATLTNVHVTDAQAPGCARTAGEIAQIPPHNSSTFAPGESVSYDCSLDDVTESFTNTAVATGTPPVGDDVSAQDSADVKVISPAISITKKPDTQVIRSGDTANWTITVTNTGDSTLFNVHVTDAQAPGCERTAAQIVADRGSSTFDPQDSYSYDCSLANVTSDFTNTAVATGTDETERDVSAEDSADVDVINPHITILKSPDTQTIVSGQTATFTIQVINDGDSTLTNVVVTDALAPGCARTSADIAGLASMPPAPAAGSTVTYQCTLANVTASFTNTAVATGTPPVGPNVSSQDTAGVTVVPPVTHPAIQIVKDPKSQTVTKGNTATFTITVLNTGDVALTDVVVTDALSPNCNKTIGNLAPGQSVSYQCTRPNVQSSFTNVAVVTGKAGGTTVTDQDTAPVTAKAPFVPKVVPKVVSHKKPKATG